MTPSIQDLRPPHHELAIHALMSEAERVESQDVV